MRQSPPIKLHIPPWATRVYLFLCVALIPWTIYLSIVLPTRHLSQHWDVSWGGLDIGIIITLLLTAFTAYKKYKWVVISASAAGTLLLADAWFDVLSSRKGLQFVESVILALIFEIPIAIMSFAIAYHALDKNID